MPSMGKVQHIASTNPKLETFVRNVNEDIDNLNQLIEAYNNSESQNRISDLTKILKHQQYIENKYSDKHKSACLDFATEIQEKLFSALKKEFASNGIPSLYDIADSEIPPKPNIFAKLLADMEPDKVKQLIIILAKGEDFDRNELKQLYTINENPEFYSFLNNNAISFLGGSNSKNFKITPNDGNPPYVLKLENRLGMPKLPVDYLQKGAVKENLTEIMSARQSTVDLNGATKTYTILTTIFCSSGDLIAHAKKYARNTEKDLDNTINMYEQMLDVLINIDEANCALPDMKNSNWLVTENDELIIADTKSFIFCENDKTIDYIKTTAKTADSFVQTRFMNPPEFYSHLAQGIPISATKMHAFMYGKNLYQYLTKCPDHRLESRTSDTLNFSNPIFSTETGQQFKLLIQDLVREELAERITLSEAKEKLTLLKKDRLKKQMLDTLQDINASGLGDKDLKMQRFIAEQESQINNETDLQTLLNINQELKRILQEQRITKCIKILIEQNYRDKIGNFTIGIKTKINSIEDAICNIDVQDRGKIQYIDDEQGRKVHAALAAHRNFSSLRGLKFKNDNKEIDEKLSAKIYKSFKDMLNEIKNNDNDNDNDNDKVYSKK